MKETLKQFKKLKADLDKYHAAVRKINTDLEKYISTVESIIHIGESLTGLWMPIDSKQEKDNGTEAT